MGRGGSGCGRGECVAGREKTPQNCHLYKDATPTITSDQSDDNDEWTTSDNDISKVINEKLAEMMRTKFTMTPAKLILNQK